MLLLFLFSLNKHLGLDNWDQFHFTNGVSLVELFPVGSSTNSAVSLGDGRAICCYPLDQLPCFAIRSVAPPLDTFVAL